MKYFCCLIIIYLSFIVISCTNKQKNGHLVEVENRMQKESMTQILSSIEKHQQEDSVSIEKKKRIKKITSNEEDIIEIAELKKQERIDLINDYNPICIFPLEQEAHFLGGSKELYKFLRRNIGYSIQTSEKGLEGRVVISFVIDKDGSVTKIQILKGLDFSADREAIRVVGSMYKWIPAKINVGLYPCFLYYL